jgi:membrane protein implicated in regulation of membrane protease activity
MTGGPPQHAASQRHSRLVAYLALEAPGWAAVVLVAWILVTRLSWPSLMIAVVAAPFIIKDILLFPLVSRALGPPAPAQPLGAIGYTVEALAPRGYVRVAGELWEAGGSVGLQHDHLVDVPTRRTRPHVGHAHR